MKIRLNIFTIDKIASNPFQTLPKIKDSDFYFVDFDFQQCKHNENYN